MNGFLRLFQTWRKMGSYEMAGSGQGELGMGTDSKETGVSQTARVGPFQPALPYSLAAHHSGVATSAGPPSLQSIEQACGSACSGPSFGQEQTRRSGLSPDRSAWEEPQGHPPTQASHVRTGSQGNRPAQDRRHGEGAEHVCLHSIPASPCTSFPALPCES